MRKTYSVFAWIVAGGVFVQAAAIAFGFGGMASYVQDGGVVDKGLVESRTLGNFTGEIGFPIHGIVGGMVIPLAAILLVVISFLVKVPGARKWAAIVLGLVILQAMLGYSIKDVPYLGLIHGANALAVLLSAVWAARLMARAQGQPSEATARARATV